jgi:hypothetical protein
MRTSTGSPERRSSRTARESRVAAIAVTGTDHHGNFSQPSCTAIRIETTYQTTAAVHPHSVVPARKSSRTCPLAHPRNRLGTPLVCLFIFVPERLRERRPRSTMSLHITNCGRVRRCCRMSFVGARDDLRWRDFDPLCSPVGSAHKYFLYAGVWPHRRSPPCATPLS